MSWVKAMSRALAEPTLRDTYSTFTVIEMTMNASSGQSTASEQRAVSALPSSKHPRRHRVQESQSETEDAASESMALEQCPECHGALRTISGETICTECGLVVDEEQIDHGPEWRTFEDDEHDPERTGAPLTASRHDRGLSTEIGRHRDGYGNELSWEKRRQLTRLRREHARGRFRSKREQNLGHGLGEVKRVTSALGLTDGLRAQACALFRRAQATGLLPGRSIESMAAGCVYAVCRCNGLGRSLSEVAPIAACERSAVETAYSVLNTELALPAQPITPRTVLGQLASELELSAAIERRARTLAAQAEEEDLTNGKQPSGFAAACVYTAAHEYRCPLTQAEIAAAADTSCVTLRTHFRALEAIIVEESKERGTEGASEPRVGR